MLSALLAAELRVARVDSLIVELDEFSVVHFVRIVVDVSKVEALLIVLSVHPDDTIVLTLLFSNFFENLWRPERAIVTPVTSPAVDTPRVAQFYKLDIVTKLLDSNHSVGMALDETLVIFIFVRTRL